jgi:AcrR family transcriptional regulator
MSSSPKDFELSPTKLARRNKILAVAEDLVKRQGYRATTMEALADAALISKATLYSYFGDKDAVFAAVSAQLAADILKAIDAVSRTDDSSVAKVSGMLLAKHNMIFDRYRSSPFAHEILENRVTAAPDIFNALDSDIVARLTKVLKEHGLKQASASSMARILYYASKGIADNSADARSMRSDIGLFVSTVM